MRIIDLLRMSTANLFKRKVRTILTVLGVVIGVASIVVMVSLGLGLNKATMESLQDYASLTAITVTPPYNAEGSSEKDKKFLDDNLVQELERIPHVQTVDPYLDIDVLAKYGVYEGYFTLRGMPVQAFDSMNIEVGQGTLPQEGAGELQIFFGNQIITNFYNAKTYEYYWDTGVLPDVDLMNDSIFYILDQERYYQSQSGSSNEEGGAVKKAKKYLFTTCGIGAGDENTYNSHSYSAYCDINELLPLLKKEIKGRAIPGQPTNSKGKPYKEVYYSGLIINVDDMKNVADVTQMITDMGYQAYNDAEWIESEQQTLNMIEAVLPVSSGNRYHQYHDDVNL